MCPVYSVRYLSGLYRLGRYTQPDPLGLLDGPSIFQYSRSSPLRHVDFTGEVTLPEIPPWPGITCLTAKFLVIYYCHFNSPRCEDHDDCKTLATKFAQKVACISAQKAVNTLCYGDPADADHGNRFPDYLNGANRCEELFNSKPECQQCK